MFQSAKNHDEEDDSWLDEPSEEKAPAQTLNATSPVEMSSEYLTTFLADSTESGVKEVGRSGLMQQALVNDENGDENDFNMDL